MFNFLKKLIGKGDAEDNSKKKNPAKPKPNLIKKQSVTSLEKKPSIKKSASTLKNKTNTSKPKKEKQSIQTRPTSKEEKKKTGFFSFTEKIKQGLKKTREKLDIDLTSLFSSKTIDESFFEELEMILLSADVGYSATQQIISNLRTQTKKEKLSEPNELKNLLKKQLTEILRRIESPLIEIKQKPFIILVVGVNGSGKTTSIGKLTKLLLDEGKTVLIAAGDTFRAAATEQLNVWGDRNKVTVISQQTGDPSAVIFDAIQSAKAKNIDIVIADTAGRLPTQQHLIDELAKIKRVIQKHDENAPHETLLVLDANTGQNALNQIKTFNQAVPLSGLIMTKLDGTAKGGIAAAIAQENPLPLRFIGVGEQIDDLKIFTAEDYVEGLLDD
ncbi:MAG: signal recognition particle-docking protein FtsY [Nitrosomonadales bacterium]